MEWLANRRDTALQQEQAKTNSLAKRRRSSVARPTTITTLQLEPVQTSRLLNLPPELRDLIYHQVFLFETHCIKPAYTVPSVLRTCKQLYIEAIRPYYALTTFHCLDEDSTISWLVHLPQEYLNIIPEIKYDTRWIILTTPFIPIPGAECWLFQRLLRRLSELDFDVDLLGQQIDKRGDIWGNGRLKVSFYDLDIRGCGEIKWTDKPGLIEDVLEGRH